MVKEKQNKMLFKNQRLRKVLGILASGWGKDVERDIPTNRYN